MKVDDVEILRFVENKMPADKRQAFESLMANDKELAEKVKLMQASSLPYAAAFDALKVPAMPEALGDRFEDLVFSGQKNRSAQKRSGLLVAALCLSFFIAGLLLREPMDSVILQADNESPAAHTSFNLVDAMMVYQALYTRETVAKVKQSSDSANKVIEAFNSQSEAALSISDFGVLGYEFKRVQKLAYKGETILQLVYLPKGEGSPVALCVTRLTESFGVKTSPMTYSFAEMNARLWSDSKLSYMLMAPFANTDLDQLTGLSAS